MSFPFDYRRALFLLFPVALAAAEFQAGVARVDITPKGPIWLSGYANRTKPSEGVALPLSAKALALQDAKGNRVVFITTDLIGLPRPVADLAAARIQKQYDLDRSRLVLNSSHTHTGPVVRPNLMTMFLLTPEQSRVLDDYAQHLTDQLVDVAGAALGDLKPAKLSLGHGKAAFAINRRQMNPNNRVTIGLNPTGPVDHDVPVLSITDRQGALRAVLFGYACHNTTLTGEFYQLSGDYAGYAQSAIEKAHPGATALFLMLTGGDQNPNPRSRLELAIQHGQELAAAVDQVLSTGLKPLQPSIRTALKMTDLEFARHSREQFEQESHDANQFKVNRAKAMLRAYDEARPVRRVSYPVQAIRLAPDFTVVTLGGEVVVGYALRTKQEYRGHDVIVAGYSNDVMCYIPTRKVLSEGGYEANDSMIYYGQPGPFADTVEETIFSAIHDVLKRVGLQPAQK